VETLIGVFVTGFVLILAGRLLRKRAERKERDTP